MGLDLDLPWCTELLSPPLSPLSVCFYHLLHVPSLSTGPLLLFLLLLLNIVLSLYVVFPPPPIHSGFLPVAIPLALHGNSTQLYSAHHLCTWAVSLSNIPRSPFQESDFSLSYCRQYLLFVSLSLKAMYVVWRWILGAQVQVSSSMYPLQLQVLSPIT